jgi:futalosine hydrolase
MSGRASIGSPALILIPTELERRVVEDAGGIPVGLAIVAICGFGPIAAAARAAELIARLRPARVVLLGIAGTYAEVDHPLGDALAFERVAVDGIGAGALGSRALGFAQWDGSAEASAIYESLALSREREPLPVETASDASTLLTVCSASASRGEAIARQKQYVGTVAEDMEGFGVALACAIARTPLAIVRGISNVAGDRDVARWKIREALVRARAVTLEILES